MIDFAKQVLYATKAIQDDVLEIIPNEDRSLDYPRINLEYEQDDIYLALMNVSESLGNSYAQVKIDIQSDTRLSWAGTAHEIREILATLLRILAPDDLVIGQSWYRQDSNTSGPTQKQRVQFILRQRNASSNEEKVLGQVTGIEDMICNLVRSTYNRASDAAHRFKERSEVNKILRYFEAFAYDLLNL